jgi:hypothetical protein
MTPSDLFTPQMWTLNSDKVPKFSQDVADGSYTFAASTGCLVRSTDATLQSKIWFATPALDSDTINQLESLQLFTRARFQRLETDPVGKTIAPGDSFSWFDIVILEKPTDTVPKTVNGVSMVWLSHANLVNDYGANGVGGQLFDENDKQQPRAAEIKQIKSSLAVSHQANSSLSKLTPSTLFSALTHSQETL